MARRKNTDHGEMLVNADRYMTAWFCYTLKDDAEATKVFTGDKQLIIEKLVIKDVEDGKSLQSLYFGLCRDF